MTTLRKGIYYFPFYREAFDYAVAHGYPHNRIILYGLGYAIQIRVSGPYVGPDSLPCI